MNALFKFKIFLYIIFLFFEFLNIFLHKPVNIHGDINLNEKRRMGTRDGDGANV